MHPEPDHDRDAALERAVGRALAGLPAPRAPRSLLPRVLAAAAAIRPRPWYTRAWLTWPRGWQAASLAAVAILIAAGVTLSPAADGLADGLVALANPASARMTLVLHGAELTASVVRVFWSAVFAPIAFVAFAVAVVVALGGGVCWNTINRLAVDR